MVMARWQRTIVDGAGNVIPGANFEVRKEVPGAPLAALKSDRAGVTGISNPGVADSNGDVGFHVVGGAYKIRVWLGPSGAPTYEKIWRYEPIGTAQELDAFRDSPSNFTVVRVVATTNVAIATALENGDTIDGVVLATGDWVLLSGQSTAAENGVYSVPASGAATRADSFANYDDHPGRYFSVMEGSAGADKLYRCTSNNGGTLGSTALVISEFTNGSASPTTTRGDIIRRGVSADERLALGSSGYQLSSNGTDAVWAGFVQAGTGPVTRTWQNKARDIINAADFGVTADGVTNDTAAMNLALAAAAGKTLVLPPGVIVINAALNAITTNGTFIEGQGVDATTIYTSSLTTNVITFSGVSGGGVRGVSFNASGFRTAGAYIDISSSGNIWIRENSLNASFWGINRSGSTEPCHIESNRIQVAANGSGIRLTGATGSVVITSNLIIGDNATPPKAGIELIEVSGVWMSNNDVYMCGDALLMQPASSNNCENIFATGNAWDSGTQNGINVTPSSGGVVQRVHFTNDWVASNAARGIILAGSGSIKGFSFCNGFLYANGQQGIAVANGTNIDFSHNAVCGNSTASSGAVDGINFQPNISGFRVIGNRSGADDGFASSAQRYGIRVEPGTSNNYIIAFNDVRSNATGGLSCLGTGTANRVVDNIGYNPVGATAAANVGTSPATITAGASPETHYLRQSATNTATVTQGGQQIHTLVGATTYHPVHLGPNESYTVTWTTTQPTYTKYVH